MGEELSNDEGVDVELDEVCGGPAGERDVEVAGEEGRSGVVAGAVEDSQEQMAEAEGRWPWNGIDHTSQRRNPQAQVRGRFPIPQYSEPG